MINLKNGKIKISDELEITQGYTFEQFKKTKYYNGQDGILYITLPGEYILDGRRYIVTLIFINYLIYSVSLFCCDIDFTWDEEPERKKLHDRILKESNIDTEKKYSWGEISSILDMRSYCSQILIIYRQSSNDIICNN